MTIQGDSNWDRWIFATMSGDCVTQFGSTYPVFIEGTHRGLPTNTELIEFRMDGPDQKQPSRSYFILSCEINILCRSFMDDDDYHKMRRLIGEVKSWLGQDHCIYRYGDGPDDDDSFLGTLQLKNRRSKELVLVNYFGQIDPKYRLEEATVAAAFDLYVDKLPEVRRWVKLTTIFTDSVNFTLNE